MVHTMVNNLSYTAKHKEIHVHQRSAFGEAKESHRQSLSPKGPSQLKHLSVLFQMSGK